MLEPRTFKAGWDKRTWTAYTPPAFSVESGKHTISFIVGDDAQEGNGGLKCFNWINNVTIKRIQQ
jgi:hypothetical protein